MVPSLSLHHRRTREYYPYDKYKSPHTETPTSNRVGGRGYSGVVKTQSAKICLNFNFRGWGWVCGVGYSGVGKTQSAKICLKQNSKCQDLPKFHTTYVETNKQKREERE